MNTAETSTKAFHLDSNGLWWVVRPCRLERA